LQRFNLFGQKEIIEEKVEENAFKFAKENLQIAFKDIKEVVKPYFITTESNPLPQEQFYQEVPNLIQEGSFLGRSFETMKNFTFKTISLFDPLTTFVFKGFIFEKLENLSERKLKEESKVTRTFSFLNKYLFSALTLVTVIIFLVSCYFSIQNNEMVNPLNLKKLETWKYPFRSFENAYKTVMANLVSLGFMIKHFLLAVYCYLFLIEYYLVR